MQGPCPPVEQASSNQLIEPQKSTQSQENGKLATVLMNGQQLPQSGSIQLFRQIPPKVTTSTPLQIDSHPQNQAIVTGGIPQISTKKDNLQTLPAINNVPTPTVQIPGNPSSTWVAITSDSTISTPSQSQTTIVQARQTPIPATGPTPAIKIQAHPVSKPQVQLSASNVPTIRPNPATSRPTPKSTPPPPQPGPVPTLTIPTSSEQTPKPNPDPKHVPQANVLQQAGAIRLVTPGAVPKLSKEKDWAAQQYINKILYSGTARALGLDDNVAKVVRESNPAAQGGGTGGAGAPAPAARAEKLVEVPGGGQSKVVVASNAGYTGTGQAGGAKARVKGGVDVVQKLIESTVGASQRANASHGHSATTVPLSTSGIGLGSDVGVKRSAAMAALVPDVGMKVARKSKPIEIRSQPVGQQAGGVGKSQGVPLSSENLRLGVVTDKRASSSHHSTTNPEHVDRTSPQHSNQTRPTPPSDPISLPSLILNQPTNITSTTSQPPTPSRIATQATTLVQPFTISTARPQSAPQLPSPRHVDPNEPSNPHSTSALSTPARQPAAPPRLDKAQSVDGVSKMQQAVVPPRPVLPTEQIRAILGEGQVASAQPFWRLTTPGGPRPAGTAAPTGAISIKSVPLTTTSVPVAVSSAPVTAKLGLSRVQETVTLGKEHVDRAEPERATRSKQQHAVISIPSKPVMSKAVSQEGAGGQMYTLKAANVGGEAAAQGGQITCIKAGAPAVQLKPRLSIVTRGSTGRTTVGPPRGMLTATGVRLTRGAIINSGGRVQQPSVKVEGGVDGGEHSGGSGSSGDTPLSRVVQRVGRTGKSDEGQRAKGKGSVRNAAINASGKNRSGLTVQFKEEKAEGSSGSDEGGPNDDINGKPLVALAARYPCTRASNQLPPNHIPKDVTSRSRRKRAAVDQSDDEDAAETAVDWGEEFQVAVERCVYVRPAKIPRKALDMIGTAVIEAGPSVVPIVPSTAVVVNTTKPSSGRGSKAATFSIPAVPCTKLGDFGLYQRHYLAQQASDILQMKYPHQQQTLGFSTMGISLKQLWTDDEEERFGQCYKRHGKDFNKYNQLLPNKTYQDLVLYYYNLWKLKATPMCRKWWVICDIGRKRRLKQIKSKK